jgi:hypothetical protein
MVDIRINTSGLTQSQFLLPERNTEILEGLHEPIIQLEPSEYTFQSPLLLALAANFKFQVTADGLIDYDPIHDPFLSGRGTTTLTVRGFPITLAFDAKQPLSHDLMFNQAARDVILARTQTHHVLNLIPGTGYSFRATPNTIADFSFDVEANGKVTIAPEYKGFAETDGTTLTISGYRITIDGSALSHDLRLYLIGNEEILSRHQTHPLTLIPTAGYTFWPTIRDLANFRFDLSLDGQIILDPKYADVAMVQADVLVLKGYPITIDGRSLSQDLKLDLIGNTDNLSRNQTYPLNVFPAKGYAFQPAAKIPENFQFEVDLNGQIVVDPKYTNFAVAAGRSLILKEEMQMNWEITGNNGTDATVNFLGTTDEQPLVLKTNNNEVLRADTVGQVGIGTSSPQNQLHVGAGTSAIVSSRVNAVIASNNPDAGIAIAQNSGVNVLLQASGAGGYIGTTSNHPLVFRTNDLDRMVVETNGNLRVTGEVSGVGVRGVSVSGVGVWATSETNEAIHAETNATIAAIAAYNLNAAGSGFAIFGKKEGESGFAGFFDGNVWVSKKLSVGGDIVLANADCAEDFDIAELSNAEPGTVMVLDAEGALKPSDRPYDKRVAGVISGAGNYKPGLILDKQKSDKNRMPIALMGKVYCKVDASYGAIEVGDLLTTSPTSGHAMRANDPLQAFGAVIGKALRPLATGQDLIPILIALQ